MMKKIFLSALVLCCTSIAQAAMEPLDNQSLGSVDGQAGADLSWQLSLNHGMDANGNSTNTSNCTQLIYCRLGVAVNNRYDNGAYKDRNGNIFKADGTAGTSADIGKKYWLVFKGIQGTINLQQVGLDAADITYTGSTSNKTGIQLSFDALKPIMIRNFGYDSLAIEMDSVANEGAGNVPGYFASSTYAVANTFDGKHSTIANSGRETGFTGLNINGNLSIAGTIKVFGCEGHARC